jgi:hypothetical protein
MSEISAYVITHISKFVTMKWLIFRNAKLQKNIKGNFHLYPNSASVWRFTYVHYKNSSHSKQMKFPQFDNMGPREPKVIETGVKGQAL